MEPCGVGTLLLTNMIMSCAYRVGNALMEAANISGIPHSFVVDSSGTIRFAGHPAQPEFAAAVQEARILNP